MEQAGARAVQDSNQNGILGLLSNFVNRGNPSRTLNAVENNSAASNFVVTATTDQYPVALNSQATSENSHNSCETQNQHNNSNDSYRVNDSSVCDTAKLPKVTRPKISHNNICKTISEIASNQESLLSACAMPQNALLEPEMSNLAATTSGSKYLPAQSDLDLVSVESTGIYQPQSWDTNDMNCQRSVGESCDTNGFVDSRQLCMSASDDSAPIPSSYINSNPAIGFNPGHISGDFQSQQPPFIQQADCGDPSNRLDQFIQTSQLPIQDFQHHLQQDNYSSHASQGLSISTTYNKMENYNEVSLYTNNDSVALSQSTDLHRHSLPINYERPRTAEPYLSKPPLQPQGVYDDLQVEDGLIVGSENEKKLTATPIPSDAEKMSSSSSMGGSSHDGSPSSNEAETELTQSAASSDATFPVSGTGNFLNYNSSAASFGGGRSRVNKTASDVGVTSNKSTLNKSSHGQAPVPENVVEFDESFSDYNIVQSATGNEEIPVSPPNYRSDDPPPCDSPTSNPAKKDKLSSDGKASQLSESSTSWSVVKEERRKRKLEKKMQQEQEKIVSQRLSCHDRSKEEVLSRKHSHHKHKHKHKSKSHHKNENAKYQLSNARVSLPQASSITTYSNSGLLPKVTADPTNNVRLNTTKSAAPPRSITEKVAKERLKAVGAVAKHPNNQTKSIAFENSQSSIAAKSYSPANQIRNLTRTERPAPPTSTAASKPDSFPTMTGAATATPICRWQTVTAVKGPKMPPMLSEIDRIPKRGRPSKKMTEINLKFKAEANEKKSKATTPNVASETSNVVATYTINESGCYESLDNKTKPNQRSKERAEAFRNELLEISKKTTIQKKTAGAKDVVGAFKAVGVRTRKQASSTSNESEDAKKKVKVKGKVFGGDSTSKAPDKIDVMDANAVYTFSDLAKQFKISNSILFRAMEQSQRSNMSRKNSRGGPRQKEKQQKTKGTKTSLDEKPLESLPFPSPQISKSSSPPSSNENVKVSPDPVLAVEKSEPPIKPTSLSSEKSSDLHVDVVKRKKKMKKHKKAKNESGKKKKKDKKKSKRKEKRFSDSVFHPESNNDVFSNSASSERLTIEKATEKKTSQSKSIGQKQVVSDSQLKHRFEKSSKLSINEKSADIVNTSLKKIGSDSSLSAGEEPGYSGESSSDAEVTTKFSNIKEQTSVSDMKIAVVPSTSAQTSSASSSVFGFGASSTLPSFQGIKEHGGLLQLSEQSKSPVETSLVRAKKHKHKKKKVTGRTKNVTDPEFMSKLEDIAGSLKKLKLTPVIGFLSSSSFGGNPTNVFARTFTRSFSNDKSDQTDVFSYRDPSSNRAKQKRLNTHNATNNTSNNTNSSSSAKHAPNMSVFCRFKFFENHGYVRPYTVPSGADLLKAASSPKPFSPVPGGISAHKASQPAALPIITDASTSAELVNAPANNVRDACDSRATNAATQEKPAPRKPGRPPGKLSKVSRSKQNSSKVEKDLAQGKEIDSNDSTGREKNKKTRSLESRTSDATSNTPVTQSNTGVDGNTQLSLPEKNTASVSVKSPASSSSAVAPINQDLVNHIKAAITATLSKADVCSDAVAKTVDSAVASYLQNMENPKAQQTNQIPPSSTNENPVKVPRRRGRPPKYPKLLQKLKETGEDSLPLDKHPKKLWASKHQGAKCTEKLIIKFRNRRPGRPRKYPSLDPKDDDGAVEGPAAKIRKTSARVSKDSSKGEHLRYKSNVVDPPPLLVGELERAVQLENLKHKSAKSTTSKNSDKDLNSTFSSAVQSSKRSRKNVSDPTMKAPQEDRLATGHLFTDAPGKLGLKKSLESVVAQLKSKTVPVIAQSSSTKKHSSVRNSGVDSSKERETIGHLSQVVLHENVSKKRQNDDTSNEEKPEKRKRETLEVTKCHNLMAVSPTNASKNNWLEAGLFSSTFKLNSSTNAELDRDPVSSPLFPPPDHAGLSLREKQKSFQLSHDIWLSYRQNKIGHSLTDSYISIDENVYADVASGSERCDVVCDCEPRSSPLENCGGDCKNRMNLIECSEKTCVLEKKCSNNAIQNKQFWTHFEKFQTSEKGWGIRSTTDILQGIALLEFVGEVVSEAEFHHRVFENYSAHQHRYYLLFEPGKILDFFRFGNLSRFVNHSCKPNSEVQRWYSAGQYHLVLFSKHPIRAGDEVTFDYASYMCDLFTPLQTCRCNSTNCLGTIGTSRRSNDLSRSAKSIAVLSKKKKTSLGVEEGGRLLYTTVNENHMQPTSTEERNFIKLHRPFLLRNLTRIKHQHEQANKQRSNLIERTNKAENISTSDKRGLLYEIIKDIFESVMTCKDENGVSIAIPFINLRSQQKSGAAKDPFDLSFVEDKIVTQQYEKFDEFSADLLHAFRNAEKKFGRKSQLGKDVARLRRVYAASRGSALSRLGENRDKTKNKDESDPRLEDRRRNGDYIRCICGIYKDEGVMIQCEKCFVWQHCDCMRVQAEDYTDGVEYLCEECDGREVDREVELLPQPPSAPPGHTYYLTLQKDNLLIRQGDCVRLIHDHCLRQRQANTAPVRSSYRLQSHSTQDRMDFLRIKKLWTDDNGDKFAYGYHFVRPQDTKHAESRLFFTNELLATPFHEIVPLDAVVSLCCVMDLETYRRGKPKGFKDNDIFICQHRTDLSLRIVCKVIKNRYPICTKPHVFDAYPVPLMTVRDYQVPEQYRKSQSRRTQWLKSVDHETKSDEDESSDDDKATSRCDEVSSDPTYVEADGLAVATDERNIKEKRLNGILKKLLKDASCRESTGGV